MKIKLNKKKKLLSVVDLNIVSTGWNFFLYSFIHEIPVVYMPKLNKIGALFFGYYNTSEILSTTHPK